MRPVLFADIEVAMRALLAVPQKDWDALATKLIAEARTADRWRQETGQTHPRLGPGTLMGAAMAHDHVPRTTPMGPQEIAAVGVLCKALLRPEGHHTA